MDNLPEHLESSPVKEDANSKRDFWIGFIGWWIFNIIAGLIQFGLAYGVSMLPYNPDATFYTIFNTLPSVLGCLVLLLNIGALIFFAFRRKQIALGMLVAFGVSIAISLLIGIIAAVACFVILGQYNNP
jgi:hypothetical protein